MSDSFQDSTAVVQVLDSLGEGRGGLTKSVFERFAFLSKGRRSLLVTVNFQPEVRQIFAKLQAQGKIPTHTELLNFHEDMRKSRRIFPSRKAPLLKRYLAREATELTEERFRAKTLRRYFRDGVFLGVDGYSKEGEWLFTQEHDRQKPWLLVSEEVPWANGRRALRNFYDGSGAIRYRIYYADSGTPYLTAWVTPSGYEYRAVSKLGARRPSIVKDVKTANSAWLEMKLASFTRAILFADEPRTNFAFNTSSPNVVRIATIHADHRSSHDPRLFKRWVSDYVEREKHIDHFVFPTDAQARLFSDDTRVSRDKIEVVSHAVDIIRARPADDPSEKRIVYLGRLAPEKRIDHVLEAFALVQKEVAGVTLSLYGDGTEEEVLKQRARELGIDEVVSFEGRTDSPLTMLGKADVLLLTSKSEGFGLVILESLAVGTPVVAYDVPYGPGEMISSGANGQLVQDGDIEGLADAVIKVVSGSNIPLLRSGALETARRYSRDRWSERWQSLVFPAN